MQTPHHALCYAAAAGDDERLLAYRLLGRVLPFAQPKLLPPWLHRLCLNVGESLWQSGDAAAAAAPTAHRSSRPPCGDGSCAGGEVWGAPPLMTRELSAHGVLLQCRMPAAEGRRPSSIAVALPPAALRAVGGTVFVHTLSLNGTVKDEAPLAWLGVTEHEGKPPVADEEESEESEESEKSKHGCHTTTCLYNHCDKRFAILQRETRSRN